jgi:hypothetical protein
LHFKSKAAFVHHRQKQRGFEIYLKADDNESSEKKNRIYLILQDNAVTGKLYFLHVIPGILHVSRNLCA